MPDNLGIISFSQGLYFTYEITGSETLNDLFRVTWFVNAKAKPVLFAL